MNFLVKLFSADYTNHLKSVHRRGWVLMTFPFIHLFFLHFWKISYFTFSKWTVDLGSIFSVILKFVIMYRKQVKWSTFIYLFYLPKPFFSFNLLTTLRFQLFIMIHNRKYFLEIILKKTSLWIENIKKTVNLFFDICYCQFIVFLCLYAISSYWHLQ